MAVSKIDNGLQDQINDLNSNFKSVFDAFLRTSDLNNVKTTRIGYAGGVYNAPNTPSSLSWGTCICIANNDGSEVRQIWFPNDNNNIYIRFYRNSQWSTWVEIII